MPTRANGPGLLDLSQPRTVAQLFGATWRLYWRHLLVWLTLAGLLVVPFQIFTLLISTGSHGDAVSGHQAAGDSLLLLLLDYVVVVAVVSAFQARAVAMLGDGERLLLPAIMRRSLPATPVVIAASIVTAIGVGVGFVLFLIPGVWILLRLYVVAQTAAIERTDWPTSLRRAFSLTRGSSWRVLGLLFAVAAINLTLDVIVLGATQSTPSLVQDIAVVAIALLSQSFTALLSALLYFDLRAREAGPARRPYG